MARPVHFEIQADDVERAKNFYAEVFGWAFEDYSGTTGSPYFGVLTGNDNEPGINGGLLQRPAAAPGREQGTNAAVLTMQVADYDATLEAILAHGGEVAMPKFALKGMAWQGYFIDTEGNTFGIHQPDENAA
ncbi:VOC family protein [Granulicoccus phenolivorans]|uniref:VOC family protein n=1 Tax=Granulicoccus phenolivorans TaxID=266854 RepID=UPI000421EB71|nr:VOC family protein [Granulicoccus phenolivorans]